MDNVFIQKAPIGSTLVTKGTSIFNFIFKGYPTRFTKTDERKPEFWGWRDKLPNYIQKAISMRTMGFMMVKDEALLFHLNSKGQADLTKGHKGLVIANKDTVGTPQTLPINGQMFWQSGQGMEWMRQKIKETLVDYFTPRIVQQCPPSGIWPRKGAFLQVEFIFYVPIKEVAEDATTTQSMDIDNHAYPYVKVLMDTFTELTVIKGDDPRYIRGVYSHYVDVMSEEEMRLEVVFHVCENTDGIVPKIYISPTPLPGRPVVPEIDPL